MALSSFAIIDLSYNETLIYNTRRLVLDIRKICSRSFQGKGGQITGSEHRSNADKAGRSKSAHTTDSVTGRTSSCQSRSKYHNYTTPEGKHLFSTSSGSMYG